MNDWNDDTLKTCYKAYGIPTDRLPYSDAFENMLADYQRTTEATVSAQQVWTRLCHLRKKGQLPRIR